MVRSSLSLAGILLSAVLLVNAQEPSCGNARTAFQSVGGTTGQIFTSLQPLAGSMCQLGTTCCSLDAETTFKQATVEGYKTKVSSQLRQGLGVCGEHSMFDAMSRFIAENKNQLVGDITRVYSFYFSGFATLFDRFFDYLGQSVHSGNSTELPKEFNQVFFEVFLASFLSNPNAPRDIPSTTEFRSCFYNIFLDLNGHTVQDWLRGFERSWNITMRYFRALRAMEHVVDGILSQQNLTEQCQVSLVRMTECAHCAGLTDSAQSCNGICLNTLRGCLLDLGDLVEPMRAFSESLIGMKNRVLTFNPFNQVTLLQSHIFSFISSSSGSFVSAYSLINARCPIPLTGRRRRETDGGMAGGLIRRSARGTITVPLDTLNDSAHCLLKNMGLFTHLPDTLCGGEGVSSGNDNCWNGRQLGSYSRNVVDYNRRLQMDNPEVLICPQQRSRFTEEIRILRYMTRELNALTGMCSGDDEDCLVVPPTTLYYDLEAITSNPEVTATPSSDDDNDMEVSGSGSDEIDACRPPSPTVGATTAAPTTREATTATPTTRAATPTTREATTATPTTITTVPTTMATPTTRAATTATPTREATTATPTTQEATPTTREATTATPTTREATTATPPPPTRAATTATPTMRAATTATPTTKAATTATPTTRAATTATPTTREATTATSTTAAPPAVSTGPTGIVVESTGTVRIVPVPDHTGIPVDIGEIIPGEIADDQGGSGSGDNGSRGLLPSTLTLCVGLALTVIALSLAMPSSS